MSSWQKKWKYLNTKAWMFTRLYLVIVFSGKFYLPGLLNICQHSISSYLYNISSALTVIVVLVPCWACCTWGLQPLTQRWDVFICLLSERSAIWIYLLCLHVLHTLTKIVIELIVIPLACLPHFSSPPPIPMLAAPFICVTAPAFIYRLHVMVRAERLRCREGGSGERWFARGQGNVWPWPFSSIKDRLNMSIHHVWMRNIVCVCVCLCLWAGVSKFCDLLF